MINNPKEAVGICGLFCGTCPSFADGVCRGCLSDQVRGDCVKCSHGFRDCAKRHSVTWCYECPEFPCVRLEKFKDAHVVNGISHHEHIMEYVARQREIGIEAWVKEQEKTHACPVCGELIVWCERECRHCGGSRDV